MDREILFRGKPKTDYWFFSQIWVDSCKDGFVYGSLLVSKDKYYICVSAICAINQCVSNGTTSMIEVDPSTVGQYTGLMDRNGKRIFEGDVVEYGGGKYKVVFVSNPHAYFGLDMIQEFGEIWPFSHSVHAGIMSVIGNIYDNPETVEV